ncbi:MAG: alpha/beta hydrolase [Rhodobacteraceae bacterium]|nr:alpha/beta hydrolase [Paracoccaceae bacterium]
MTRPRRFLPALWLALAALAVVMLERDRAGLEISRFDVFDTPVTFYTLPGSDGPAVVVTHGFAGSRQIMEAWSLTLARAGYRVLAFDFMGHGRNPWRAT